MNAINCPCQKASRINEESSCKDAWEELKNIHNECPAVKFLVPDFRSWRETNKEPEKTSFHQSTLVLAFRRGHLNRITSPIHRYCLSNKNTLTNQYKTDLREAWFSYDDSSERHKKLRIWMGRMAELKIAEWLEENDWKIERMEAWGYKSDIKAISPDDKETFIEVKYIGQEDEDFKHLVVHLADGSDTKSGNPYIAFNYVLFRIFEAAKQLSKKPNSTNAKKKVALVIDATTWDLMKLQLKWMPYNNRYSFFDEDVKEDKIWQDFLQKKILPGNNLTCTPTTIATLNQITIFQLQEWQLIKEMEWTPTATSIAKKNWEQASDKEMYNLYQAHIRFDYDLFHSLRAC